MRGGKLPYACEVTGGFLDCVFNCHMVFRCAVSGDYYLASAVPTFQRIFFNDLQEKMRSKNRAKGKNCRFNRQEFPGLGNNCLAEKRDSLQAMRNE
jgi:hypothetical protein